ncbi:MAG: hypothetical protein KAR54_03615, partial [Candidatus Pacebacteria bacterium]|nr:hypothetical protein [Candidatus Paceibacterota bacterium]
MKMEEDVNQQINTTQSVGVGYQCNDGSVIDNSIPNSIISAIMERKCVIFIGAGMSIEAGLPSGKELAEKL